MSNQKAFTLIQDDLAFTQLCSELAHNVTLAIDTEFVRESTYYPRFCLLQVTDAQATYCIDPLALGSLEPLKRLLAHDGTCFVLHSARQDLEVLLQSTGYLPSSILDTQIAAGLSGYHEQIGYAALVEEMTRIQLSKEQTRTDWSQRPLSSAQLHYAADDVIHLRSIFELLSERLELLGRSEWWKEDSLALLSTKLYDPPVTEAWKKVRGLLDLPPKALARSLILSEWREETAQKLDIPRTWVMKDEALLYWADLDHLPEEALRIRNASRELQSQQCALLSAKLQGEIPLEFALELSQSARRKSDPARKTLIKRLSETNQRCAQELGISASVLATRKDLETLIDQPERSRLLVGWRKTVIGDDLKKTALQG